MKFDSDPKKDSVDLSKRGLSFAAAALLGCSFFWD